MPDPRGPQSPPVASFHEGYLTVHIYLHVAADTREYYDVVVYRKIRTATGITYKRGANLKPTDLPSMVRLLKEAQRWLQDRILLPAQNSAAS